MGFWGALVCFFFSRKDWLNVCTPGLTELKTLGYRDTDQSMLQQVGKVIPGRGKQSVCVSHTEACHFRSVFPSTSTRAVPNHFLNLEKAGFVCSHQQRGIKTVVPAGKADSMIKLQQQEPIFLGQNSGLPREMVEDPTRNLNICLNSFQKGRTNLKRHSF